MLNITENEMGGERKRERRNRENQTASVEFRGTLAFAEEKFSSQINMLFTLSPFLLLTGWL